VGYASEPRSRTPVAGKCNVISHGSGQPRSSVIKAVMNPPGLGSLDADQGIQVGRCSSNPRLLWEDLRGAGRYGATSAR
jgi:hypothetical protein